MQGLNSREREKRLNFALSYAVLFSLLVVVRPLVDARENSWMFIAAASNLLPVAILANRRWQKVGAVLLLVSSSAAALSYLDLRDSTYHLLAKVLAALWGTGVAILVWSWISAQSKPHPYNLIQTSPPAKDIPDLTPAQRTSHPADEARAEILERLRLQAIAEKSPLSEIELQFVDYNRIHFPEIAREVEERFYQSHDYWKFKDTIISLFSNAVRTDRVRDSNARKKYKHTIHVLSRGRRDEQLLTFLKAGFYRARTSAELTLDAVLLVLIGLALATIVIGGAYFWVGRY